MTLFLPSFTDKSIVPKSVNDMKIIHAGKVLENGKTIAESRANVSDLPGGVITMHVVVQPAVVKKKTGLFIYTITMKIFIQTMVPFSFPALLISTDCVILE